MISWKKINKSINRTMNNLQKSRRIMGGYLANSVKKNSKNKNKFLHNESLTFNCIFNLILLLLL